MERTRLLAENFEAYHFKKFDPNNCHVQFETGFAYDIDGDGVKDKIVVKEDSWVKIPRTRDQYTPQTFMRHSTVNVTAYLTKNKIWHADNTKKSKFVFRDRYEMKLDNFNNNPAGACPFPSFAGLYAVKDQDYVNNSSNLI